LNQAISLGFLDAQFERQQLSVAVSRGSASIDLVLALGPGYLIGPLTIDDSPIREDIVRNLAPFKTGDRYSADALASYTRRLRDSRFFARARVLPEFDKIADGTVPLRVELEARKPNRVRLGAGYATDVGVRLRAGWDRYLIDDRGHSATFDTELSDPRRSANVEYRVPDPRRPATRAWLYSAGAQRESIDGTTSTQQNARVARERRHGVGLIDTTYLRYQRDRGLPGDSAVEFRALMAGFDVQFGRSIELPGERELALDSALQWLMAHEDLGADFGFFRANLSLGARTEIQPKHWLRGRVELGRLWRADVDVMPTSLRFFAGGDGSIRGFGPRDASPQNAEGTATGGNRLLVTSLEYEYRFRENWGAAVFVDRGRAWVDSGEPTRTGAGLGARWYSPVGPIMFDVARPVEAGDGDWRVHVAIGL
ncbi:MAG: BamA/TamA family outer membrane protein, partial [Pseudomonadota bacterium]